MSSPTTYEPHPRVRYACSNHSVRPRPAQHSAQSTSEPCEQLRFFVQVSQKSHSHLPKPVSTRPARLCHLASSRSRGPCRRRRRAQPATGQDMIHNGLSSYDPQRPCRGGQGFAKGGEGSERPVHRHSHLSRRRGRGDAAGTRGGTAEEPPRWELSPYGSHTLSLAPKTRRTSRSRPHVPAGARSAAGTTVSARGRASADGFSTA